MTIPPLLLGILIGLALAMSTRMRDALVEGLGRRSIALGVAGAAGVAGIQVIWLGLATLVAAGSAQSLAPLTRPLAVLGGAILLAVAADVLLRALILGPTGGAPRALPDDPAKISLQMGLIAALDPRALLVLLGWLALAPATAAAVDPSSSVLGILMAVVAWWGGLAGLGATTRSASRLRRSANVAGAGLLAFLAATTLLA